MFGKVCRTRYFQPFEEVSVSALVQSQTLEDMGGLGFRVEGVFKFSSANFSFDWTIASLLEIPSYETSQSPTSVDRNADGNALGNWPHVDPWSGVELCAIINEPLHEGEPLYGRDRLL